MTARTHAVGVGADVDRPAGGDPDSRPARAGYGPTLALTVTLAAASFVLAMSALILIVHPGVSGFLNQLVVGQNQHAKTAVYVFSFAVILPASLIGAPRLADAIAAGPNGVALPVLAALLVGTLAATIVLLRLLALIVWGDTLVAVLCGVAAWSVLAAGALARAARGRPWPGLLSMAPVAPVTSAVAAALVLGVVLCVTDVSSLSALAIVLGASVAVALVLAIGRISPPRPPRAAGAGLDAAMVILLLLAIPNIVVFTSSGALPNIYFPPGVIQFQQDWILGPVNQLLGGGALLVNVPSSQYGVGLVYFLAGWFHVVPIGYGTFGLLDGIVTALFYVAGYGVLRIAGVARLLAASALAFAVVVLLYDLPYSVGPLPEQGPLRFGLPIAVVLAAVLVARCPRRARSARAGGLVVLGLSSIWAVEAFAYTAFTLAAVLVLEAVLRAPDGRVRWLGGQAVLALAACVCAHLVLAGATLVATGHLPDWSQYLAYVNGLLLGGREGTTTYGFADWSPGLAMGAACLASAAAITLLVTRARPAAERHRTKLVALTGVTAYSIASFSYTDNRSSTYLLLYVALPVLMAAALWLSLLLAPAQGTSLRVRRAALSFALAVAVVMLASAWPAIGGHFSQSALAHAYPGGGLRAALHRLEHPPPIDPRAVEVERLLRRYVPGKRALVLFPTTPDLAIEALMRAGRSSPLFLGDPSEDVFIPSIWMPRISREIGRLRPGSRVLVDTAAERAIARLRGHPDGYALAHPITGSSPEIEWILHRLDRRFRLAPIHRDGLGLVVAELEPRSAT